MIAAAAVLSVLAGDPVVIDPSVRPIETCPIKSIGFRTATEAWAADGCGAILRSTDGGRGWELLTDAELTAPEVCGKGSKLYRVAWLTAKTGLAFSKDLWCVLRTEDGGQHWKKIEADDDRPELDAVKPGSEIVMPLLTRGDGSSLTLSLSSSHGAVRWGAVKRRVFRSNASGAWYPVGELPSDAEDIAATEMDDLLVETSDGLLRGSGSGKRAWRAANPTDKADWERLTTGSDPALRDFECVGQGPSWVSIEWRIAGCFGGRGSSSRIELTKTHAVIGKDWVSLSAGRDAVTRIRDAIAKPETRWDCDFETRETARLEWQCEGRRAHRFLFSAHACSHPASTSTGKMSRWYGGSEQGYSRAISLLEIAESLEGPKDAWH